MRELVSGYSDVTTPVRYWGETAGEGCAMSLGRPGRRVTALRAVHRDPRRTVSKV